MKGAPLRLSPFNARPHRAAWFKEMLRNVNKCLRDEYVFVDNVWWSRKEEQDRNNARGIIQWRARMAASRAT